MRLRNRQTGKVYTLSEDLYIEYTQGGKIELRVIIPGGNMPYYYDSLDKLYHEWEDYKPKEPIIEDRKSRKIFREWAEHFGAESFRVTHVHNYGKGRTTSIESTDLVTEPLIELPGYIGEDSKIYNKIELVGEEEE